MSVAAPLSINYVLADTSLFGGVKIVLHHAGLLAARGHDVRIVCPGERPAWFDLAARFVHVDRLTPDALPSADVHVATFWPTIATVAQAASGQPAHFCQGFEGSYTHNVAEHPAIMAAYATPIAALALAPHLAELVQTRFGRPARVVPPALEPEWRPRARWGPRRRPRIAVLHPFENDWKGVRTALEAVRTVRARGVDCTLVRISQWPLCEAERAILAPDEFHCNVPPERVAAVLRGCDLLLAPSWEQEGFGLPVLEAMASGVPVVASDIGAFRSYAAEAAVLLDPHDVEGFAAAAAAVLGDRGAWRRRRQRGLAAARAFRPEAVVPRVEDALAWVAGGSWRGQLGAAAGRQGVEDGA